jgi:ferric-dicitrate binding protein FerR (iron transport regulator)
MADSPVTNTPPIRSEADADVARLLHLSGRRPGPPADRLARLRLAARDELHATIRRRARRRWLMWGPASAAAAALLVVWSFRDPAPVRRSDAGAVRLVSVVGDVRASDARGTPTRVLSSGDLLPFGATVETGPTSRAAVSLPGGDSIRLDHATSIVLQAPAVLMLHEGALYADSSGAEGAGSHLEIRTAYGVVSDVGTQFELRLEPTGLRIRVREGEVALADRGSRLVVGLGEGLTVSRGRQPVRFPVPLFGETWSWTSEVVPPFAVEGRLLPDFLAWVSREQGWRWRFADDRAARHGSRITLHGSVEGLTPEQALSVVLPTAAMTHEVEDGALVISFLENAR